MVKSLWEICCSLFLCFSNLVVLSFFVVSPCCGCCFFVASSLVADCDGFFLDASLSDSRRSSADLQRKENRGTEYFKRKPFIAQKAKHNDALPSELSLLKRKNIVLQRLLYELLLFQKEITC